ncbi:hypothetical protein BCR34DRAFT_305164 [Clohesyomyces aquaticus]|uniref:Uncharacterized protein n=1 Tax=Clohesyomyces aquaticus TaxID=1231657 RepID=A0A1Y1ZPP9_9PLEO|nr:hypothetical protein BCR34DRAFT_305164 [Clohesyomyces aquaticus]
MEAPDWADNASGSLAPALDRAATVTQIQHWLQLPTSRLETLSILASPIWTPAPSSNSSESDPPRSPSSGIVHTCLHHDARASTQAPSLYVDSDITPTEPSVATGLASHFSGVPLLEDVDGVLQQKDSVTATTPFECSFWFLDCCYCSHDHNDWRTHCLSHFRGEELPRTVLCPLCEYVHTSDDGWTAWDYRQCHVASHHLNGQTLKTSRPDFALHLHLWQLRLIDDEELKELQGGTCSLQRTIPAGSNIVGHENRPIQLVWTEKFDFLDSCINTSSKGANDLAKDAGNVSGEPHLEDLNGDHSEDTRSVMAPRLAQLEGEIGTY